MQALDYGGARVDTQAATVQGTLEREALLNRMSNNLWRPLVAALAGWAIALGGAAEDATAAAAERLAEQEAAVREAAAQAAAGEHVGAINTVEAVIDRIERRSNRYDLALVAPLLVLGDALAGVGDDDGAFGAYDRALHITRIGRGLHHPSQVTAVYRQAGLLAERGRRSEANNRHEYAYRTLLRNHGADDPALLPGLFVLADWYLSSYNIFSARGLYEHAAAVAAKELPPEHPAHVRALRWIAATYRAERFPPYRALERRRRSGRSSPGSPFAYVDATYRGGRATSINRFARGEGALIEVVNRLQRREDAKTADVAGAMLELGDWFLLFEKRPRAYTLYRKVWEMLEANRALLASTFDAPAPLYLPLPKDPPRPAHARPGDARDGLVELSVDVDAEGLVANVETLRSEPGNLMETKVRRAMRHARYRPAFDGKAPLATKSLRVVHNFIYYPSARAGAETSANNPRPTKTLAQAAPHEEA